MIINKTTKIDEIIIVIALPPAESKHFLRKVILHYPPTQKFEEKIPVPFPVAAAASPSSAVSSPAAVSSAVPSAASPPVAEIKIFIRHP